MKTIAHLIHFMLVTLLASPWGNADPEPKSNPTPTVGQAVGIPEMIRKAEKGVFFIRVLDSDGKPVSVGTGFLIDDKGTLLTSLHVMRPTTSQAASAEALGSNGKTHLVNGITVSDESLDLALLQLAAPPEGAVPVSLAGDRSPERGARVLVLGHPQGFRFVSTDGIVSAVNRTDELPQPFRDGVCIQARPDALWIQTSAAVSPGNSGGPMLDESGKVIGIIQWMGRGPGMNFALHVAPVRELIARPSRPVSVADFARPDHELRTLIAGFSAEYQRYRQASIDFGTPSLAEPDGGKTDTPPSHPALKYFPQLLRLVEKHPDSDVGFRALETLIRAALGHGCPKEAADDVRVAAERLTAGYPNDRRLIPMLRQRPTPSLPEAQDFLRSLVARSQEAEIRALAAFSLAATLDRQAEDVAPDEETMKLARLAAESPPEFTIGNTTLASAAQDLIAKLIHSSVDCPSPAFEAMDGMGEEVTLEPFRGKHLIVAFWDKHGDFFNQTATMLDQVADNYQVPILGVTAGHTKDHGTGKNRLWNIVVDDDATLKRAWHITSSPTVFLIDPKGVIIRRLTHTPATSMTIGHSNNWNFSFSSSTSSQGGGTSLKERLSAALDSIPEIVAPRRKLLELMISGPWVAVSGWDPAESGERTVFFRKDGSTSVKWIMNWELRPPSKLHLHLQPRTTGCIELDVDFESGKARVVSLDRIRGRLIKLRDGPTPPAETATAKTIRQCLLAGEWNWYETGRVETESPRIRFRFLANGTTSTRLISAWEVMPSGEIRVYLHNGCFWSFDIDLEKQIARSNLANSQIKDSKAFVARRPGAALPGPSVIPRPRDATAAQIDLSEFYNGSFKAGWLPSNGWSRTEDKNLTRLQPGLSTMGGTDFDIRGVIQVSCIGLKDAPDFPEQVAGIKISSKATQLHFLHACAWNTRQGTAIGHYVVHYADDSTEKIPLLYGRNIRDWTRLPSAVNEPELTDAAEVWRDSNAYASRNGAHLRLARFTWKNPKPETEIRSIDLVSAMTQAAPFLMAITRE